MSFSINTNIASMEAQEYLTKNSSFQSQTINRVTSGLRIVNSGDDAAGLAIANGLRSDQAVLAQGIRNANDGTSTLQTIDSGMSNISTLLDRARTLATQSASGTFTGSRDTLNSEFQSVMTEINRQAQSIGLNTGGTFAKDLQVFIGGGRGNGTTTAIDNGSVGVDLSKSTVDTKSLGLSGYATATNSTDIGTGSAHSTVAQILASTSNQASESQAGYAEFYLTGPGFSDTTGNNRVGVAVNLNGVTDSDSLATAINAAIQSAGNGTSQQATAFKNANVQASIVTDGNGSHLQFSSSNSAFQVEAGDAMANAFMGNVAANSANGSAVAATTATTDVTAMGATSANGASESVNLNINGSNYSLTIGAGETRETTVTNLNTAINASGITASLDGNNKLQFTATGGNSVSVQATGDDSNVLGLGTFSAAATSSTGATLTASKTQNVQVKIGDQVADLGALSTGTSEAAALTALNNAFAGNSLTTAAGLTAVDNGSGSIVIKSGNNTSFSLNVYGASGQGFGFGSSTSVDSAAVATSVNAVAGGSVSPTSDANGTSTSGFLNFKGISINGSSQTVSVTANDPTGAAHAITFSLSSSNAGSIDAVLSTINSQLQQSNDSTLQSIVAVKDQKSGSNGISFVSSLSGFNVSLGTTATGTGSTSASKAQGLFQVDASNNEVQGQAVIKSSQLGTGSTVDISSQSGAENAVNALAAAVTALGNAQAAVGKGENLFNYAVNLATSQSTNEASAESQIRDANLAQEAANLTKAQILVQAGTAALAQANSAPQAILSLLKG
jgi:flagellin